MPKTDKNKNSDVMLTYADYFSFPQDQRVELIDGRVFDMTPAPTLEHQEILADLITQFRTFLRGKPCRVFPEPDVLLPDGNEDDEKTRTVVRPDLVIVCDSLKMDGKRVRGAPDLVIEILSPDTASRDCILKRRKYEIAGVKEFWVVHPSDRMVMVFLLEENMTFGKLEFYDSQSKVPVKILPGLEIDLPLVFPPIPKAVREPPRKYVSAKKRKSK